MNDLQPYNYNTELRTAATPMESTPVDALAALWNRRVLIVMIVAGTLAASAFYTAVAPKKWRAEVQLILIQRAPEGKEANAPGYPSPMPETPETQVAMLQSVSMAQKTQQWFENQALQTGQPVPDEVTDATKFSNDITVLNPKDSDLIDLDVDAPSQDQALNIANAAALAFVQWKRELAQQDIRETISQLEADVDGAKQQLDRYNQEEYAYRQKNHIVNVAAQESNDLTIYQQDQLNVTQVQQDLASQQAQLSALKSQLAAINTQILGGTGVRDELFVQTLQSQLEQAEINRAAEAQKVTPLYPGQLTTMDAQIADLKKRLASAIQGTVTNTTPSLASQGTLMTSYKQTQVNVAFDQAKLASAITLRNDAQAVLNAMPEFDTHLSRLDLDVQSATQRYDDLETALNAARLQINTTTGNVQITQSAVCSKLPYKPNWLTNLLLGGVIGLFIAIVFALIAEQGGRKVQDIGQIERLRLGPVLGVLPPLDRTAIAAVTEGLSTAALSEHFSVVRTNLLGILAQIQHINGQVVLVTSAVSGEGKSLILTELARTLTDAGKKVIVIDANLRSPSLARFFPSNQDEGLSNVLLEQAAFDDVITTIDQNLAVLHAGPIPDEPTRLLSSPQFIGMIHSLRSRADVVLVDSSSCEVADPLLVAPHVDYVVHVVGSNKSNETQVQGALSALAAVSYVGVIVNYANIAQIAPYQLVNAAAKVAFSQPGEGQPIAGQIRLASPESQLVAKSGRIGSQGEIVPMSTIIGENR